MSNRIVQRTCDPGGVACSAIDLLVVHRRSPEDHYYSHVLGVACKPSFGKDSTIMWMTLRMLCGRNSFELSKIETLSSQIVLLPWAA
jgi:hypothetical protein